MRIPKIRVVQKKTELSLRHLERGIKFEGYISIFHFSYYQLDLSYHYWLFHTGIKSTGASYEYDEYIGMIILRHWILTEVARWYLYMGLLSSILTSLWLLGPNVFCCQSLLLQPIPVCICTPHMCNGFNWGWIATTPKLEFYDQWPSMNFLRKLPHR